MRGGSSRPHETGKEPRMGAEHSRCLRGSRGSTSLCAHCAFPAHARGGRKGKRTKDCSQQQNDAYGQVVFCCSLGCHWQQRPPHVPGFLPHEGMSQLCPHIQGAVVTPGPGGAAPSEGLVFVCRTPRPSRKWMSSRTWIVTSRAQQSDGKNLLSLRCPRRRCSRRSGRTKRPCRSCACCAACGRTG